MKLARYESTGTPAPSRRIVQTPVPQADTAVGDALQDIGKVGYEFASRIEEARQDAQLVKAETAAKARLDKLRFEMEQDTTIPDAETEHYHSVEADEIIRDVAQGIGSERTRELWMTRIQERKLDGDNWALKLGRQRTVDRIRGEHVTANADLAERVGDVTLRRDTFEGMVADRKAAILRDRQRGVFDEETAASLLVKLDQADHDDRMFRAKDAIEKHVEADRIADVDEIIAGFESQKDKKALKDYRDAIEQDIRTQRNIAEAEKLRFQTQNAELIETDIITGHVPLTRLDTALNKGDIAQSHYNTLVRMRRTEMDRREAEAKLSAADTQAYRDWSQDTKLKIESLPKRILAGGAGAIEQLSPQLYADYQMMHPGDKRAVQEQMIKLADGGSTANEVDAIQQDLVNEAKRALGAIGKDWDLTNPESEEELAMAARLRKYAQEYALDSKGEPIKTEDARTIVARLMADTRETKGALWWRKTNPLAELPGDIRLNDANRRFVEEQVGVPWGYYQDIRETMRARNGRYPSDAEVRQVYDAIGAQ